MYLSINEFKPRDFCGSNALWNYVSLRSHIIHHDRSGFSPPNHEGKKREKTNDIYNVVNNGIKQ